MYIVGNKLFYNKLLFVIKIDQQPGTYNIHVLSLISHTLYTSLFIKNKKYKNISKLNI